MDIASAPVVSTERRSGFLSDEKWEAISDRLRLSRREFEIVRCILDGSSEAAIARTLSISTHTVHTHLERLYRKLDVSNRSDLVVRVFAAYVTLESPD
jgi:DNA-binding CsgD family transcriptional regulator